jgi:hypothetical protein
MNISNTCFRGHAGDTEPVEVLRRDVLDHNDRLCAGYFNTELEAWGALLAANDEALVWAVKDFVTRPLRRKKIRAAVDILIAAETNFECWQAKQRAKT